MASSAISDHLFDHLIGYFLSSRQRIEIGGFSSGAKGVAFSNQKATLDSFGGEALALNQSDLIGVIDQAHDEALGRNFSSKIAKGLLDINHPKDTLALDIFMQQIRMMDGLV